MPKEGPPPHHLQDIPRLLFAAGVSALRRPARLLLPPTAVLYTARCAGEVAAAALKVQDGALAQAAGTFSDSVSYRMGDLARATKQFLDLHGARRKHAAQEIVHTPLP